MIEVAEILSGRVTQGAAPVAEGLVVLGHPPQPRTAPWGGFLGEIPQGAAPAQPFREDIPALMISSTRRMLLAITVLETGKNIVTVAKLSFIFSASSSCRWDPQFYIT